MKANPDYKWFNTDKSHPVRDGKPSTRPSNSLVAYHGEIPRTETQDANMGRYRESLIWGDTRHRDAGRQYG